MIELTHVIVNCDVSYDNGAIIKAYYPDGSQILPNGNKYKIYPKDVFFESENESIDYKSPIAEKLNIKKSMIYHTKKEKIQ